MLRRYSQYGECIFFKNRYVQPVEVFSKNVRPWPPWKEVLFVGHGICGRIDAVCSCLGHFAGVGCSSCADGYLGASCDIVDREISRSGILVDYTTIQADTSTGGVAVVDHSYGRLIAGDYSDVLRQNWPHLIVEFYLVYECNQIGQFQKK